MKNSKLIDLLKSFEKEDWRAFTEFIRSPYYNKRKEAIHLFNYLKKEAPNFKPTKIEKRKVYKAIFKNNDFVEKDFNYLMHYLHQLGKKFIGLRFYEKNSSRPQQDIMHGLVERKLNKQYLYLRKQQDKILQKTTLRGSNYYYQRYETAIIANKQFLNRQVRTFNSNISDAISYLDYFYLAEKLKLTCEILDRQRIFKEQYEIKSLDLLENLWSQIPLDNKPMIAQYLQIYRMLTNENGEKHYQNLIQLFRKSDVDLELVDKQKILSYAINYCARQIRSSGKRKYFMEQCLELYRHGIDAKILLQKGILSPWHFKNMIKLGINLQQYHWVEKFILENVHLLEEKFRHDALNFNLADLSYHQKKYDKAQEQLIKVEFSDIFYTISAKELLVKIYYETDNIEVLNTKKLKKRIIETELLTAKNWFLGIIEKIDN